MYDIKPLVLVIEDDFIIALDIKQILEKNGFSVISGINSFEQAIEIINEQKPNLVLLDVNLKQIKDGIDIGHFLLRFDKIPYIYITSYSDKITIERIKETRPYGYITKPFKDVDIITNINIVLNNFQHRNIDLSRKEDALANAVDDSPFIIKLTINHINENIHNNIEIDKLVKITRWKKHHFIRTFEKYIGQTPYQYILKRKIEIAKTLLIETDIKIADIAYEVGFNSNSNFSTRFKKITGCSAEHFRKTNRIQKWL